METERQKQWQVQKQFQVKLAQERRQSPLARGIKNFILLLS